VRVINRVSWRVKLINAAIALVFSSYGVCADDVSALCSDWKSRQDSLQASSVVVDRKCEQVVAPFTYTENLEELGKFSLCETMNSPRIFKKITDWLKDLGNSKDKGGSLAPEVRLAAQQMNWLPMKTEIAIGDAMHNQQIDSVLAKERDPKAYARAEQILKEVLNSVKETHEYQFRIFVTTNSTRNARAIPGGYVYVDYGLVKDESYMGKAYFAVAHEISHVLQRHETRAAQARIIDAVSIERKGMAGLLKTMGDVKSAGNNESIIKLFVAKELFAQFNANQELQSDACAVRLLSSALPERPQLVSSLSQFIGDLPKPESDGMQKTNTQGNEIKTIEGIIKWASSPLGRHPTSQQRSQLLNEMLIEVSKPSN
jgi:Zn-dependent protease with chaperone function